MKALEEVAIEGGAKNNVAIFDGPTANNIWFYIVERESKETFNDGDLEMIARHLVEEAGQSAMFSTPISIGENTIVYSAQHDYTKDPKVNLTGTPREVYMVIPSGVRLNGKRYVNGNVQRFPTMELTGRVPEAFVEWMRIYRYSKAQSVETYNHLMGTQFPVPKEKKRIKVWQKVALAATLLALAGGTVAGIKRINDVIRSPEYQTVVERARNTPGSNVYNAADAR